MTFKTLPDLQAQSAAILAHLATWLGNKPGRSFTLAYTSQGWRAALEVEEQAFPDCFESIGEMGGCSALDAAAQAAQVAALDTAD